MSFKFGEIVETDTTARVFRGVIGKVVGPGVAAGSLRIHVNLTAEQSTALSGMNPSIKQGDYLFLEFPESELHAYGNERTSNYGVIF